MSYRQTVAYVETPQERRRRVGLESAIKRRARARYAIQINLTGGHVAGGKWAACWLTFLCSTKEEAWAYMEKVNPLKFFPAARSASVECVWY